MLEEDTPQMTIWRIHIACWVTKTTETHSDYVYVLLFHGNNIYVNTLHCYIIHTLPVFSFDL